MRLIGQVLVDQGRERGDPLPATGRLLERAAAEDEVAGVDARRASGCSPVVRPWIARSTACMAASASARQVVLSDFLYSFPR